MNSLCSVSSWLQQNIIYNRNLIFNTVLMTYNIPSCLVIRFFFLFACKCVHCAHVTVALEMEFQMVGFVMWMLGIESWFSTRAVNVLNIRADSPVPRWLGFHTPLNLLSDESRDSMPNCKYFGKLGILGKYLHIMFSVSPIFHKYSSLNACFIMSC